ncbi:unnamed protein product [Amoebophrya sp. A120]|nr:unnamed protein product [Amoebophrya sp. A120]|eukprot:GSA120T00015736001.1
MPWPAREQNGRAALVARWLSRRVGGCVGASAWQKPTGGAKDVAAVHRLPSSCIKWAALSLDTDPYGQKRSLASCRAKESDGIRESRRKCKGAPTKPKAPARRKAPAAHFLARPGYRSRPPAVLIAWDRAAPQGFRQLPPLHALPLVRARFLSRHVCQAARRLRVAATAAAALRVGTVRPAPGAERAITFGPPLQARTHHSCSRPSLCASGVRSQGESCKRWGRKVKIYS